MFSLRTERRTNFRDEDCEKRDNPRQVRRWSPEVVDLLYALCQWFYTGLTQQLEACSRLSEEYLVIQVLRPAGWWPAVYT